MKIPDSSLPLSCRFLPAFCLKRLMRSSASSYVFAPSSISFSLVVFFLVHKKMVKRMGDKTSEGAKKKREREDERPLKAIKHCNVKILFLSWFRYKCSVFVAQRPRFAGKREEGDDEEGRTRKTKWRRTTIWFFLHAKNALFSIFFFLSSSSFLLSSSLLGLKGNVLLILVMTMRILDEEGEEVFLRETIP